MAYILLALFPIGWLTGFSFILPGLAAMAVVYRPYGLSREAKLFLLVPFLLFLSLLYSVIQNGLDFRGLAAFYNVYTWIGGICMLVLMEREGVKIFADPVQSKLEKRISRLAKFVVALVVGPLILWLLGIIPSDMKLSTTLGFLAQQPLPGILRFYETIEFLRPDYILDAHTVRFNSMGIYPNEGALIAGGWGLLWLAFRARISASIVRSRLIDITILLVVALTASRGAVVAYVAAALLVSVPSFGTSRPAKIANIGFRTLFVVFLLAVGVLQSASIMESLNQLREGSSLHRLESYAYAVALTLQQNPLFGLGFKPFDPYTLHIPIGSHSTFVSSFTKGGLLTLAAVSFAFFGAIRPYLRSAVFGFGALGEENRAEVRTTKYFARAVFFSLLWGLFEDVDAPALGALTFFSVLGLSIGWAHYLQVRGSVVGKGVDRLREVRFGPGQRSYQSR